MRAKDFVDFDILKTIILKIGSLTLIFIGETACSYVPEKFIICKKLLKVADHQKVCPLKISSYKINSKHLAMDVMTHRELEIAIELFS